MVFDAVFIIGGGTRVPGENHLPVANHLQTLSHNNETRQSVIV
jgi:hypothetical protein